MVTKEVFSAVSKPFIQFWVHSADIILYGILDIILLPVNGGIMIDALLLMEKSKR